MLLNGSDHGSSLTLSFLPFPTYQARLDLMTSMDLAIAFQNTNPPACNFTGLRIQSSTVPGPMYFWIITYVHKISVFKSLQTPLAAKDFANKNIFFRPQPPRPFGIAILLQWADGVTCDSYFPLQIKLKHLLHATSKIPFGIHAVSTIYFCWKLVLSLNWF